MCSGGQTGVPGIDPKLISTMNIKKVRSARDPPLVYKNQHVWFKSPKVFEGSNV